MSVAVDVTLPPGWFPLAPIPGALIAAAAVTPQGHTVATMVVRMQRCPGVASGDDAAAVFAAVPREDSSAVAARAVRWCAPDAVVVLAAHADPDAAVTAHDLAAALDQTVVYAVDSTGNAIRSSSAGDAKDGCRGSTRTV